MTQVGRLMRLDLYRCLFRWRWLLPLLLMAYETFSAVTNLDQIAREQEKAMASIFNAWDAILYAWVQPLFSFSILSALFFFSTMDLTNDKEWREMIFLRAESRENWWLAKVGTLVVSALVFLFLAVLGSIIIAASFLPVESSWSDGTAAGMLAFSLNTDMLQLSPLRVFANVLMLQCLGWIAVGTLAQVVSIRYNPATGFVTGLLVLASALTAMYLEAKPPYALISPHVHFDINFHSFGSAPSPWLGVTMSVIYWLLWILACLRLGLLAVEKQDLTFANKAKG